MIEFFVILRLPFSNYNNSSCCTISLNSTALESFLLENYPPGDFYYTQGDFLISSLQQLSSDATITICLKGRGGKGGFGANLKRSGKLAGRNTTNFDACRDLQGRRLGDLRRAQLLADQKEKEQSQTDLSAEKKRKEEEEEELREIVEADVEEMLLIMKKNKKIVKEVEKKESDGMIKAAVNAAKRQRETDAKEGDDTKKKKKASLWNASSDTSDSE